jgi:3-oxo-5-alpha-steroid 4-dehydrogenase 1
MRGGKPTPLTVWAMAAVFCLYNGYMQTRFILTEAPIPAPITDRTLAGALMWLAGLGINWEADHILINLRKPGETGALNCGPARWGCPGTA